MSISGVLTAYLIPAIGWTSAALFLSAYILVSQGRLDARSSAYQLLNLGGAIGLGISNSAHGAFPAATLNLIWCLVGLHALATRYYRQ